MTIDEIIFSLLLQSPPIYEMASTTPDTPKVDEDQGPWWTILHWIFDVLVRPCKPIVLPLLTRDDQPHAVTGTILCPRDSGDKRVLLCLQESPAGPPILLLDLPIAACDLAGLCRIALECPRERSGGGPLLAEPAWAVFCNGRRKGFAGRRAATEEDAWALEAVCAVSAGAGVLPRRASPGRGAGGFRYLRGSFERVVGSADSESYHLMDPAGCLAHEELSFFFLRV